MRDLQAYGVAFVVLVAPVDPVLERRLDGTPGLNRVSAVVRRLAVAGRRPLASACSCWTRRPRR